MSAQALAESTPAARAAGGFRWTALTLAIPWAGWWLLACLPLSGFWNTNPQYSYGWLVLPLALVLAWRRWPARPAPGDPSPWALPLIYAAAAVLLPAWLIVQANPGWRLVPSILALSAVTGTIALAGQLGGRPWMRHFAFPILFTLTAVPWPSSPEEDLIQGLMRFVAGITVAIMNLAGVPAVQHGNLVEIASGLLGVDEACSGVRSLQASLMAALFLGEFYQLKARPRWLLVLAAFLTALLTNIVRTTFLSWSAARGGIGAVAHWHDPAGYTILTACLIVVALLANWLSVRHSPPASESTAPAVPSPSLPFFTPFLIGGWLLVVYTSSEIWYFKPLATVTETWTLVFPSDFKDEPVPADALALLGCDRTRSVIWTDLSGEKWRAAFLEWFPNGSRSSILARVHRPEICLQGSGLAEAGPRRIIPVSVAGFDLRFQSMHFRDLGGHDFYVFYCPWEVVPGEPGRNVIFSGDTRTASLLRVWHRERVLGQQSAELMVAGAASRDAAEASLQRQLRAMVARQTIPPATHPR